MIGIQGLNLLQDIQKEGLIILRVVEADIQCQKKNIQSQKTDILDHGQDQVKERINPRIDIQDHGLGILDQDPDHGHVQNPGIQMTITEGNTADLGLLQEIHVLEIGTLDKSILGHLLGIQNQVPKSLDTHDQDHMKGTKNMMIDIESGLMMIILTIISIEDIRIMIMNRTLIRDAGREEGDSGHVVAGTCTTGEILGKEVMDIWEGFHCLPILMTLMLCVNLAKWSHPTCNT